MAGSAHTAPPVSIADHAADADGLLDHLGVRRVHVAGHSNSGPVVLQLALDRPELVHTLTLLEPALFTVPSADAFKHAGPSLEAYGAGDHERAVAGFLSAVSGLDWETCQAVLDQHVPGGTRRSRTPTPCSASNSPPSAPGRSVPSKRPPSTSRSLGPRHRHGAAVRRRPALLHSWFPQVEDSTIEGVGHLLHIQRPQPVAQAMAEFWPGTR